MFDPSEGLIAPRLVGSDGYVGFGASACARANSEPVGLGQGLLEVTVGPGACTRAVFDDFGACDRQRASHDGATAPIYCESWRAKLSPADAQKPQAEAESEGAPEGEEVEKIGKLRARWHANSSPLYARR